MRKSLLIAGTLLLLSACGTKPVISMLPEGVQTVRGILRSAPLSLERRGTHILSSTGSDIAYVESSTLHLGQYEGRTVTIHGIVQKNIDPAFLPVLVADDVIVHDQQYRTINSSALGLKYDVPETWTQAGSGRHVMYRLPNAKDDLLSIVRDAPAPLPGGTALVVAGKRAVRLEERGNPKQTVHLPLGDSTVIFTLTPPEDPAEAAEATAAFIHLLNNAVITAPQLTGSGSAAQASGSGSVMPCGGVAGLLCPGGYYCAITDRINNIGICAAIRKR